MNTRKKDLLKEFLFRIDRCMQQYRSAVCACNMQLHEFSVWKLLSQYLSGYFYRYYSSVSVERTILKTLNEEIHNIKRTLPHLKIKRSIQFTQHYLDILLEYRYKLQASN